jgi:hypothetical protein
MVGFIIFLRFFFFYFFCVFDSREVQQPQVEDPRAVGDRVAVAGWQWYGCVAGGSGYLGVFEWARLRHY